jgi:hypothetical protein
MLSDMDNDSNNDFEVETPTGSVPSETLLELSERTAVLPRCDHDALKASQSSWELLKFVGIQPDWDDNGNESPLALRNCSCGQTMGRPATAIDFVDEQLRQLMQTVARNAHTRDLRPSAVRLEKQTVRVGGGL